MGYQNLFGILFSLLGSWSAQATLSQYGFYGVHEHATGLNLTYLNEISHRANVLPVSYNPLATQTQLTEMAQQLRSRGLKVSLYIDIGAERFCNYHRWISTYPHEIAARRADLEGIKARLISSGLMSEVISIQPSEELWTRYYSGELDGWFAHCGGSLVGEQRRTYFRSGIEGIIADMKAVFSNQRIMMVENHWNAYTHPPFAGLDVLGIDAYLNRSISDQCTGVERQYFDAHVTAAFNEASQFGRPLFMVAHGFQSSSFPLPSTCALRWYVDLARSRSDIQGVFWFMWSDAFDPRGTGTITGLRNFPSQYSYVLEIGRQAVDVLGVIARRVGTAYEVLSPHFDEAYYRRIYPDVDHAVRNGWFSSGLQHFVLYGGRERRRPNAWFDENSYRSINHDVHAAVGIWLSSGFEHYLRWGASEGRTVIPNFSERAYLTRYIDVRNAVRDHGWYWFSGLKHYVLAGRAEGRVGL